MERYKRYNRRSVSVVTGPSVFAVSVSDAKAFMRVDDATEDAIIQRFIAAAQEAAKQYLQRSITPETLLLRMDGFGYDGDDALVSLGAGTFTGNVDWLIGRDGEFGLPFSPVISVTSITTFNRDNAASVFDAASYQLDPSGGRVYLNQGAVWPTNLRSRAAVEVVYQAGYTVVPAPIVQGILDHVAMMYEHRGVCEMPDASRSVMEAYRILDPLAWQ